MLILLVNQEINFRYLCVANMFKINNILYKTLVIVLYITYLILISFFQKSMVRFFNFCIFLLMIPCAKIKRVLQYILYPAPVFLYVPNKGELITVLNNLFCQRNIKQSL